MIPDVYRYNLPMFYQPPYLDTMPNGTLCGLLAQSVPEGPDVIHNHKKKVKRPPIHRNKDS